MRASKQVALYGVIVCAFLGLYLLLSISPKSVATYNDNTSIESRVNISNMAPSVSQVMFYQYSNGATTSLTLSEGTTQMLVCNATVDDWNGWTDLAAINATIYNTVGYTSNSANDNNNHYFNGSCTNSSINITALRFSCGFNVWYYADNSTWNCNMTAKDGSNATHNAIDSTPPIINSLAALNLSINLIDFGEMQPGDTSAADRNVNVTNTGNININLSLNGFGLNEFDNLSMKCTIGNISVDTLRYNISSGQSHATSMSNLTSYMLPSGIPGLAVQRRTDDADTAKLASTNTTFWKLSVPMGAKGFCNGTVTFSAVA